MTGEFVDRRLLSLRKARSLADRVAVALEQYESPDILFIHRDAENQDPKARLHDLLRDASGLTGRRRKKYHVQTAANRVVGFLGGIEPLRQLPAFRRFETNLRAALGGLDG